MLGVIKHKHYKTVTTRLVYTLTSILMYINQATVTGTLFECDSLDVTD